MANLFLVESFNPLQEPQQFMVTHHSRWVCVHAPPGYGATHITQIVPLFAALTFLKSTLCLPSSTPNDWEISPAASATSWLMQSNGSDQTGPNQRYKTQKAQQAMETMHM